MSTAQSHPAREYSAFANHSARVALQHLLDASQSRDIFQYRKIMKELGEQLGSALESKSQLQSAAKVLVVSTAEDADFLASGVIQALKSKYDVCFAVFWNNHYALSDSSRVAPIVNSYYQEGYADADALVIVKSIISGSCVVKTNLLRLLSENKELLRNVHVVAPVMHVDAQQKLKIEFSPELSSRFHFTCFAIDSEKSGEDVVPGIGGQVYQLLGFKDQPAKIGYIPDLVKNSFHFSHA